MATTSKISKNLWCTIVGEPNPVWVYFSQINPTRIPDNVITGKWVFHRHPRELKAIATKQLKEFVECRDIELLKYRPRVNNPDSSFKNNLPPMCVYANELTKDKTKKILESCNITDTYWVTNEESKLREKERIRYILSRKFYDALSRRKDF